MLLQMPAAVVVGGAALGGGSIGPLGTVFAAYILMMVVNILPELNVSVYYSTVAEDAILTLAVLTGSFSRNSSLAYHSRRAVLRWRARRNRLLSSQRYQSERRLALGLPPIATGAIGGR
jgi:ribose transport system permease protein